MSMQSVVLNDAACSASVQIQLNDGSICETSGFLVPQGLASFSNFHFASNGMSSMWL
jgi:hypothetical protein